MMQETFRFGSKILLVDEKGDQIGNYAVGHAKQLARDAGLDLVELSRSGETSVCRIMDEGKWRYEQKKKNQKQKQHTPSLKEMKFRISIDPHDQSIKVAHIKKFISKGHSVKLIVQLRGRERATPQFAKQKLEDILRELGDVKKEKMKTGGAQASIVVHP